MSVTRYLYKFSNLAETEEYTFPRNHYEMSLSQEIATPKAKIMGQPYGLRLIENAVGIKDVAKAEIRFLLYNTDSDALDEARDEIVEKCYGYGMGYLHYTDGLKAEASIVEIPTIELSYEKPHIIPIVLLFEVWEDFA